MVEHSNQRLQIDVDTFSNSICALTGHGQPLAEKVIKWEIIYQKIVTCGVSSTRANEHQPNEPLCCNHHRCVIISIGLCNNVREHMKQPVIETNSCPELD